MKNFIVGFLLITTMSINYASGCVIAVESNVEATLFKTVYGFNNLKFTTDTFSADVGIKTAYESESQTSPDPVFGTVKTTNTYKLSAEVYEMGSVIATTGSHPISELGRDSAFARDLRRALTKAGCSL